MTLWGSTSQATLWTNSDSSWTTSAPSKGLSRLETLDAEKGKVLTFGGLITSCEHRISKSGRPWGFFALEDYNGTHEFRCFGEDYVKFKEFMVEGWMVMVTTQVREQGYGREGLEAKLQAIELLSEAREKRIGRLRIQVQLSALNDGWVDQFTSSVANHPGNVGVTLEIYDDEAKLEMPSRTSKVQLNDGFVDDLEALVHPRKGAIPAGLETLRPDPCAAMGWVLSTDERPKRLKNERPVGFFPGCG